jgi:hypothetical protein
MDVCLLCCALWDRGLCDELITCPEESYRMWCVVCDLEASRMRRPRPASGRSATGKKKALISQIYFGMKWIWEISASSWFYYKDLSPCTVACTGGKNPPSYYQPIRRHVHFRWDFPTKIVCLVLIFQRSRNPKPYRHKQTNIKGKAKKLKLNLQQAMKA